MTSHAEEIKDHHGWYSRGYIPHCDLPEMLQLLMFRLNDSLPTSKLDQWSAALQSERDLELRAKIEAYLDSGYGACHLNNGRIASCVERAMLHFDGIRYRLIEWVVMPNHVHALIETMQGHPLPNILHSWKSFTAKEANRILGRSGVFWQPEYFDRFIRSAEHLAYAIKYVHENPVKAGLCARPEDWVFSSAANAKRRPVEPVNKLIFTSTTPGSETFI